MPNLDTDLCVTPNKAIKSTHLYSLFLPSAHPIQILYKYYAYAVILLLSQDASIKKGSPLDERMPGSRGKYNNACDVCHRKKIKCDGMKPLCDPCRSSGRHLECTWTKNPARKPRTEQHFEAMHKRAENLRKVLIAYRKYADYLESLLAQHPSARRIDFSASRPSIPDGLMGSSIEHDEFTIDLEVEEAASDSDDPTLPIRIPSMGLTFDEGGHILHHGHTAPFRFNISEPLTQPSRFPAIVENPQAMYILITDSDSEVHYDPDFDWSRHLPPMVPLDRRSHDKALDLFFKFFTSWCLRIVPALFLRDMYRALSVPRSQDPPKTAHYSPMLHNALVALALAFLDDSKFRDFKARQYFADKAKTFMEAECEKPNLSVIQALSLIASFHSSQGDQTLGYLYFGMSARVSQALGLNVECSEWVKSGYMEESDRLDRNWANWTTFSQDVCWSLYVGRDFCVPVPDSDFPMPVVDTTYDQMPIAYGNLQPQPNFLTKTFEATCELLVISRRIMDVVNCLNKTKVRPYVIDEFISEIDLKLNTWKGSLAPELEITVKSRPTATPHKLMLHLAYWWLFILLHRPFFHRKARPIASTDREIDHVKLCRRAAENIMELLATWRSLYSLRYCPVTLIQAAFSAGTVYLLTAMQASSGMRIAQKELRHSLDQQKLLMQYMQDIGASWQCATNIAGILKGLMQDQLRPILERKPILGSNGDKLQVPYLGDEDEETGSHSSGTSSRNGSRNRSRAPSRSKQREHNVSHSRNTSGSQLVPQNIPIAPAPQVLRSDFPQITVQIPSVPSAISASPPNLSFVDPWAVRQHSVLQTANSPISHSRSVSDVIPQRRDSDPSASYSHPPFQGQPRPNSYSISSEYLSVNGDLLSSFEREFQQMNSASATFPPFNQIFSPEELTTSAQSPYLPNELASFTGMLGGQTIPQVPFFGTIIPPSPDATVSNGPSVSFNGLFNSEASVVTDPLPDINMEEWFAG